MFLMWFELIYKKQRNWIYVVDTRLWHCQQFPVDSDKSSNGSEGCHELYKLQMAHKADRKYMDFGNSVQYKLVYWHSHRPFDIHIGFREVVLVLEAFHKLVDD